mgnify:CR=1 FL=1
MQVATFQFSKFFFQKEKKERHPWNWDVTERFTEIPRLTKMKLFNEPESIKTFINGHWLYFIARFWGGANHGRIFISYSGWGSANFLRRVELIRAIELAARFRKAFSRMKTGFWKNLKIFFILSLNRSTNHQTKVRVYFFDILAQ